MIKDFLDDEDGTSAVEYAILVAAIAAVLISTMGQIYKSLLHGMGGGSGQLLEPQLKG